MGVALQGTGEAAEQGTEIFQQGRRFFALGKGLAGQPGDDAHEVFCAVGRAAGAKQIAAPGRAQQGQRQAGIDLRRVAQQTRLELERGQILGGVGDLHHPFAAIRGLQAEILVALAVERAERAGEAV